MTHAVRHRAIDASAPDSGETLGNFEDVPRSPLGSLRSEVHNLFNSHG